MTSATITPEDILTQYDRTAEQAVLGSIMAIARANPESTAPQEIIGELMGADDFVESRHRVIYKQILEMVDRGDAPDPILLMMELPETALRLTENGTYVAHLAGSIFAHDAVTAAKSVRAFAAKRNALTWLDTKRNQVLAAPASEIGEKIQDIQESSGELVTGPAKTAWVSMAESNEIGFEYLRRAKQGAEMTGAMSPWEDLNRLLGGLKPGQISIWAGRPGMGKSTAARNYVRHVAVYQGLPSGFWSLEMPQDELSLCMLSSGSRVPLHVLRSGDVDDEDMRKLVREAERTKDAPLYFDTTPDVNAYYVEQSLIWLRNKYKDHDRMGIAAFDYLQLSSMPSDWRMSRELFIADQSRKFKKLSKKYEIPLIVVSQLNRGPEGRPDKRPMLSDLRESGSIEQDADIVVLLHRDDYYDAESPRAGEADFIVAKHRNGPTDTIAVAAQLHLSRFVDMSIDGPPSF